MPNKLLQVSQVKYLKSIYVFIFYGYSYLISLVVVADANSIFFNILNDYLLSECFKLTVCSGLLILASLYLSCSNYIFEKR